MMVDILCLENGKEILRHGVVIFYGAEQEANRKKLRDLIAIQRRSDDQESEARILSGKFGNMQPFKNWMKRCATARSAGFWKVK